MTTTLAVLGAGGHSTRNHGPALARCRRELDVGLRAVCDLDAERAAAYADEFGFETTYTDYGAMLDAEPLDGIVAVTPVERTREIAGDLLASGVPVVVEKPPGETPRETRELLDVAVEHGTDHQVSFNRRFNPALRRAREWLDDRRPPRHAHARLVRSRRFEDRFVRGTGVHAVDTVLSVMGTPRSCRSRRWCSRSEGGESAAARLAFEAAAADVHLLPDGGTGTETYAFVGPDYSVRIDAGETALRIHEGGEEVVSWQPGPDVPAYERNGTLAEMRSFLRAIRGETPFGPTLRDGLVTMETVAAVADGGTTAFE
jgi:predicted dehydrogenase